MLFGEYNHQLDAKGRLRLPAKFKPELGSKFLITKGARGCLFVFSNDKIEDIKNKIKDIPLGDNAAQDAVRMLFSSAFEAEEDGQGRFVLPAKLREYSHIEKNMIIIGAGDRAEIWAEEQWNEVSGGAAFDTAVGQLAKYGI